MTISVRQIRAARALLDLGQPELAELAGISRFTVQRLEHPEFGPERTSARVMEAVEAALVGRGVVFLAAEGGLGEGVRLLTQVDAPLIRGRSRGRSASGST